MNPSRFLVTGGSGFLGAALVKRLVSHGHIVRVLDNGFRSSDQALSEVIDDIEMVHGDIRNREIVIGALKNIDIVVHLAAVNGTENFYTQPALVLDVGVRGILNILEGCLEHDVPDIILASSSEVYQTPSKIPTDENEPLVIPDIMNPRYSYGGSKIISELLLVNYARSHFKRAIIFRPHNVYGPAMGWEHVLPQFIVRTMKGMEKHPQGTIPFLMQGNGQQTRSFIHIDDMIDGIMLLIEKGKHLNIYHIGNPEEITIADFAKKVANYFSRELEIQSDTLTQGSTERRCPNINKMRNLDFNPRISLELGLPPTIEWYASHINQRILMEKK
jgi:dTDP-glucose 4,6-dehydratase/UDP-glucose 4-epimerase